MRTQEEIKAELLLMDAVTLKILHITEQTEWLLGNTYSMASAQIVILNAAERHQEDFDTYVDLGKYGRKEVKRAVDEAYNWVVGESNIPPSQSWNDFFSLCAAAMSTDLSQFKNLQSISKRGNHGE